MALKTKFLNFITGVKAPADMTVSAPTIMDAGQPESAPAARNGALSFLGQFSIGKQLQILGGILVVLVLLVAGIVYTDQREATFNTTYVGSAGELRMLSQRLAKSSSLAIQGEAAAFKQLRDSHAKFSADLDKLAKGGVLGDTLVPPSPDNVQPQLQALAQTWEKTDKNTQQLLDMEKMLVALGDSARKINEQNAQLLDLAEQVITLKLQTNASPREIASASQLVMLTQRLAKNVSALQVGDEISPESIFLLGKDTFTFNELLNAHLKGSETLRITATTDPETRRRLSELNDVFQEFRGEINQILGGVQKLTIAKQAGSRIFRDSEALLAATSTLAGAYQESTAERTVHGIAIAILGALAVIIAGLMVKIYLDDSRQQAEAAKASRLVSEQTNRQNQDAILRLMNELGDLADGDLTVTATVSEDITGAIADSINYTIEELRVLVGRINDAAGRVTLATEIAQQTSGELLDAARRQSVEIQDAGHSVLAMADSMTRVSDEAVQSAQVARQSLNAAGKGTLAVQDSIKGMNEIRGQIQETSKRIKRLGESSQEIGEIVELISDITEQTNVLALNAAIQAASAGEAGRGFTVVAEEVQRLAERSGEATKQIAAIVKTIQTDTQSAVSAMEESTRGVVDGARLSDAAGQALAEIGEVSRNLAELIEKISDATRHQADSATSVAGKMQDILRVTEQTTAGTQKTTSAVGELAGLATELKSSVAGFKVS